MIVLVISQDATGLWEYDPGGRVVALVVVVTGRQSPQGGPNIGTGRCPTGQLDQLPTGRRQL